MAEWNPEKAIAHYTELMRLIHVGAYDERDHEGNYGVDGIEEAADGLAYRAAQHGLEFHWHEDTRTYTLEPMSDENRAAFKAAMETPGDDMESIEAHIQDINEQINQQD